MIAPHRRVIFDPAKRYASTFHSGSVMAPDGWPDRWYEIPEGWSLADVQVRFGGDGPLAPKFEQFTGEQMNAIRASLGDAFQAILDASEDSQRRRAALEERDTRTRAEIAEGFEYPPGTGQRFSLSLPAQLNLAHARTPGFLPHTWSTLDGVVVLFQTADEFEPFYAAAMFALKERLAAGHQEKRVIAG
jgi:hypothetical protein